MTSYLLDISVVQIQRWLLKAPSLKGLRGGSTMIVTATDPECIGLLLKETGAPAELASGAPIDGVVQLVLSDGMDTTAQQVTEIVLGHLRSRLPYATLRVVRKVRRDAGTSEEPRDRRLVPDADWYPPVQEWPPAVSCSWCQSAPATEEQRVGEKMLDLCVECVLRVQEAGTAKGPDAPAVEKRLVTLLGSHRPAGSTEQGHEWELVDEFPFLAALGPEKERTHLAVVYADGNAVGRFKKQIEGLRRDDLIDQLPRWIDDSVWKAVAAGVQAIQKARGAGRSSGEDSSAAVLPIVPHIVGGDDVVVSVPAHDAWTFVRELITVFHTELTESVGDELSGLDLPSLSCGVVFHHHKSPLLTAFELASELLRDKAKQQFPGQPAVAWQCITQDGSVPNGRRALRHESLVRLSPALSELSRLPQAQRHLLSQLAHEYRDNGLGDHDPVAGQIERMGLNSVAEPFHEGAGITLPDALDLIRWWRR